MNYIVRQPGREDAVFARSEEAVEHLVSNPGYARLYHGEELVMTKGIPPNAGDHDRQFFRGLLATALEA